MSAPIDAAMFMREVGEFNENRTGEDEARSLLLATADSYDGSGLVRLIFDGEAAVSTKGFSWLGPRPALGKRVVVMPIGATSVIVGELNSDPISSMMAEINKRPKGIIAFSRLAGSGPATTTNGPLTVTAALTVTANLEAGRRYRVGCPQAGLVYNSSPTPSNYRAFAAIRWNKTTPEIIQTAHIVFPAGQAGVRFDLPCVTNLIDMPAGPISLSLVAYPGGASGSLSVLAQGGGPNPIDLIIEDLGAA